MGELTTLDNLAIMLEKPVQKVFITAQAANAIRTKNNSDNIIVDVDVFQDYLDKVANEDIKNVNNKTILELSYVRSRIKRSEEMTKVSRPKELLADFDKTCKELKEKAKKHKVDLSKIRFERK